MQSKSYTYWIAFVACLGGFMQSYITCVIAGALLFITVEFNLSPLNEGHLASIILIGAILGALSSGYLADRLGRRRTLILSALIYLLSALATFLVHSFTSLLYLRLFTGLSVGLTSMLVPIYLAEIAPPEKRGAFVTCYQFSVTIGTLIAYLISLLGSSHQAWRMMFYITAIPAAIQFITLFFFPDSPKWLVGQGRMAEAKRVIDRIGGNFSDLNVKNEKIAQHKLFSSCYFLLLAIGIVLSSFQQFSGINAVVYFAPRIFAEAGLNGGNDALFATFVLGIVNVISTFVTILIIDRFGRRKLLLLSQTGVLATLIILILGFATSSPFLNLISVPTVLLYAFLYSLGLGPIVWVLISEIYPLAVRAKALSLCTFISWLSNYLVVLAFPYTLYTVGSTWTFAIYAALSFLALLFYLRYIPETKGKSLEELEKLLVHPNK